MNYTKLEGLRDLVIERALDRVPGTQEGQVATYGPLPYRRIDACGRVLAYLQLRPGRKGVRVDVAGAWPVPPGTPGSIPWAGGAASFWVRGPEDIDPVCRALAQAVHSFARKDVAA